MVILNAKKVPALLALFLALTVGAWAQQEKEASPGTQIDNYEAKKALYRELGMEWNYNDGASMEVAKQVVNSKQAQFNSNNATAPSIATIGGLGQANANANYEAKMKALTMEERLKLRTEAAKINVSSSEYANATPDKKAYIQAHPEMYNVNGTAPANLNVSKSASGKTVIPAEQYKNMSAERRNMINSNPTKFEVK